MQLVRGIFSPSSCWLWQSPKDSSETTPSTVATRPSPPPSPSKKARENRRVQVIEQSLTAAATQAKEIEWQIVLGSMCQAFSLFLHRHPHLSIQTFPQCVEAPKYDEQMAIQISRVLQRQSTPHLSNIPVTNFPEKTTKELMGLLPLGDKKKLEREYHLLHKDISEITSLLILAQKNSKIDTKELAQTLLYKIRQALERPAYKLCQCDETSLVVQFLHALCLASFANSETLPALAHLGRTISYNSETSPYLSFNENIKRAWEAAKKELPTDDPPIRYPLFSRCYESLVKGMKGYSSQLPITTIFKNMLTHVRIYSLPFKDYRGGFGNNPGAWSEEIFSLDSQQTIRARTILTASPAAGTKVAAEFLAMLQALENRQFTELNDDPYPWGCMTYSNLQTKGSGAEGLQTKTVMELEERFPFSFKPITVAQNSNFVDSVGGSEPSLVWKTTLLNILLAQDNFSKERAGNGYYFPASQQQQWNEIFPQIIDAAYGKISSTGSPEEKAKAFEELVRLGIIRYHEIKSVRDFRMKGLALGILQSRSCAVCVDRGGKANASLLWGLGNAKWNSALASLIQARGMLAKQRLMVAAKVGDLTCLTKVISHSSMHDYLEEVSAMADPQYSVTAHTINFVGIEPF